MRKRQSQRLSDDALADELVRRRGASIDWSGGPSNLTVVQGTGSVVFSLRLTVDELEALRERAINQHVTVSEIIRGALFVQSTNEVQTNTSSTVIFNSGSSLAFPTSNCLSLIAGGTSGTVVSGSMPSQLNVACSYAATENRGCQTIGAGSCVGDMFGLGNLGAWTGMVTDINTFGRSQVRGQLVFASSSTND